MEAEAKRQRQAAAVSSVTTQSRDTAEGTDLVVKKGAIRQDSMAEV